MSKGFFVVLEGGDYTGKGTQSILLAKHIQDLSEDNDVLITHEPTWRAKEIKKRLKKDEDAYSNARKMAELYVADRRTHTRDLITPNLEQGVFVVGNRYAMSTCVYQSLQGMSLSELADMHQGITQVPNITILLDITPQTAEIRSNSRKQAAEKKFEANIEFRNKVYEKYLELALSEDYQRNFGKVTIVDGNENIEEVAENVKEVFNSEYISS